MRFLSILPPLSQNPFTKVTEFGALYLLPYKSCSHLATVILLSQSLFEGRLNAEFGTFWHMMIHMYMDCHTRWLHLQTIKDLCVEYKMPTLIDCELELFIQIHSLSLLRVLWSNQLIVMALRFCTILETKSVNALVVYFVSVRFAPTMW